MGLSLIIRFGKGTGMPDSGNQNQPFGGQPRPYHHRIDQRINQPAHRRCKHARQQTDGRYVSHQHARASVTNPPVQTVIFDLRQRGSDCLSSLGNHQLPRYHESIDSEWRVLIKGFRESSTLISVRNGLSHPSLGGISESQAQGCPLRNPYSNLAESTGMNKIKPYSRRSLALNMIRMSEGPSKVSLTIGRATTTR